MIFAGDGVFVLVIYSGSNGVFTSPTGAAGTWTKVISGSYALSTGCWSGEYYIFANNTHLIKTTDLINLKFYYIASGSNPIIKVKI
jgi:hypothetical protein